MDNIFISGTGFYVPNESISNEELVHTFNNYVDMFNITHQESIQASLIAKLEKSSADFITQASGIKNRYVIDKKGILDIETMHPVLAARDNAELSLQCEMAVNAARKALENAHKTASEIDGVIVACSNTQRPYPAIAIEVQEALGINGWAYDMNAACSSATFGINAAVGAITSGLAQSVLIVNPEMYTGHLNFRDRTSHFIFGDGCSAVIIDANEPRDAQHPYQILSRKQQTKFSNNIRNNFGFLNRCENDSSTYTDKLFVQKGRNVREEVVPMAAAHINLHLQEQKIKNTEIKRLWLHQANINMNKMIAKLVLGREASSSEAPLILSEYGNTGAAGVMITFNKYHNDLTSGDLGVICSFGAGYAVGSIIVRKL